MKTSMNSTDVNAEYVKRVKEQVVGQLFFQSVTEVDEYKSRFNVVRLTAAWSLLCVFSIPAA